MRKDLTDLTDLTVVVDRSGSMSRTKNDAQGGINEFIRKQKELPGDCLFSLVQFDTTYEFVHKAKPLKDVAEDYKLVPRGGTALLDAVGRAIVETGERLKGIDESQRPGLVVFVIVTDGEENSSREFQLDKIKELIETQKNVYKWQFTFLGANQDAFAQGAAMGITLTACANYGAEKTSGAILAAGENVRRMRSAAFDGGTVACGYTDQERKGMASGK